MSSAATDMDTELYSCKNISGKACFPKVVAEADRYLTVETGRPETDYLRIKTANRAIVAKIPEKVVQELVEKRQKLVGKKFSGGLNRGEEKRLTLIDWELDRIDDARYGENLERLEEIANEHEKFANYVDNLVEDFKGQKLV